MLQAFVVVVNPSTRKGNPKVNKSEHYIKTSVCMMWVSAWSSPVWRPCELQSAASFQKKPYNPDKCINSEHLACLPLRLSCVKKSLTKTYVFAFLLNTASHSNYSTWNPSLALSLRGPGCHLHESYCSCQPRVRPHLRRPLFLQKTSRLPDPLSHFSLWRFVWWLARSGQERTCLTRWMVKTKSSWF